MILGVPLELIFSHLVSVESIWSVAHLAITRFVFRYHIPSGNCLARILLSWSLAALAEGLTEPQLIVLVLVDGS